MRGPLLFLFLRLAGRGEVSLRSSSSPWLPLLVPAPIQGPSTPRWWWWCCCVVRKDTQGEEGRGRVRRGGRLSPVTDWWWWGGQKGLVELQQQYWGSAPFLGERGQSGLLQQAPQSPAPPFTRLALFLNPRPGKKNPKSNISHHMPKMGWRGGAAGLGPSSCPLGVPPAHLSMVLGRGDTWVLTFKNRGDPSL